MTSNPSDGGALGYDIARLAVLMPPPDEGGDEINWTALYERGLVFPADYQRFVALYGGGAMDHSLWIDTPPIPGSTAFMEQMEPWTLEMSERTGRPGEQTTALVFGHGLDGEEIFWECTSQNPDEWTLIVFRRQHGPRERRWVRYDMGMVEFLVRLIERTADNPLAGKRVPGNPPVYLNWRSNP